MFLWNEERNMASEAQIAANRANAQRSTGPRTEEGKEKSARNALNHGLCAERVVIDEEDREEGRRSGPTTPTAIARRDRPRFGWSTASRSSPGGASAAR